MRLPLVEFWRSEQLVVYL